MPTKSGESVASLSLLIGVTLIDLCLWLIFENKNKAKTILKKTCCCFARLKIENEIKETENKNKTKQNWKFSKTDPLRWSRAERRRSMRETTLRETTAASTYPPTISSICGFKEQSDYVLLFLSRIENSRKNYALRGIDGSSRTGASADVDVVRLVSVNLACALLLLLLFALLLIEFDEFDVLLENT